MDIRLCTHVLSFYIILEISQISCQNAFNFVLKEYYWPKEQPNPKVQFFIKPRNFNPGSQLVDVNFSSPIPLGNNILTDINIEIETQLRGKHIWIPLFDMKEDLCKFLETFLGQLFYDLEIAAGVSPKSCPIPRGTHHAINHTIVYRTLKLQTFPFGKLKCMGGGNLKSTNERLWSYVLIVLNQP